MSEPVNEPRVKRPFVPQNGPGPRHTDPGLLGTSRRDDEYLYAPGGEGRRRTRGADGAALRAVATGVAPYRGEVPRIQLDQLDHGRLRSQPTAGRSGPPVLRRFDAAAEGRPQARAVRDGSVGEAVHRGRSAKPRRQVHICAVAPRGRHRPDTSEPVRRRRSGHHQEGHAAPRAQGLRQRRGPARLGHAGYREREPEQRHDRHDLSHHRDVAAGVPLPLHPVGALGRSSDRDAGREGGYRRPSGITGTSSSRHSP